MHSTLIKTGLALSLAATIIFSQVSPSLAQGKKDWAHSHAPGQIKKQEVHDFVANLSLPNVALENMFGGNSNSNSNSNSDKSIEQNVTVGSKGIEVSQSVRSKNNSIKQHVAINNKKVTVNQSINKTKSSNQNHSHSDMHCTNHSSVIKAEHSEVVTIDGTKVKVTINGSTVRFTDSENQPISVEFCLKAATKNSGTLTGSFGEVTFTNNGGQIPDISYVAIYGLHNDDKEIDNDDETPVITEEDETPKDQGETLSTNTKKTAVMGTSIERESVGGNLPFTGGTGSAVAQAVGLALITFGGVAMHVRRLRDKIEAQLNV